MVGKWGQLKQDTIFYLKINKTKGSHLELVSNPMSYPKCPRCEHIHVAAKASSGEFPRQCQVTQDSSCHSRLRRLGWLTGVFVNFSAWPWEKIFENNVYDMTLLYSVRISQKSHVSIPSH